MSLNEISQEKLETEYYILREDMKNKKPKAITCILKEVIVRVV